MKYRISAETERDVFEIFDYIVQDNPDAAAETIGKLLGTFERLTVYPRLGHAGREPRTREFMQPPYLIVYSVEEEVIQIHAVIHGRRLYV